jgi:hypothetical protein
MALISSSSSAEPDEGPCRSSDAEEDPEFHEKSFRSGIEMPELPRGTGGLSGK